MSLTYYKINNIYILKTKMNFGKIKNIYAKFLIDSYINESKSENKKKYKEFIKNISESPILRTQFIVYKNIENNNFNSEVSAVEYLKENISLFNEFNKKDIIKQNEKLSRKIKGHSLDYELKELHESLNDLIVLEKKAETINKIHDSFEYVKKWLLSPKKINESTNDNSKPVDANKFLDIVTKKYNEKYSNISEEEKKVIKTILSKDEKEKETLLKDMVKESITLINSSLKQFGDNLEIKSKLLEAKDIVYNLEYNKETFKEDILKIYELKTNLS
jgi:hypothetical protein